ncbi:hypothetical protein AAC387_Pa07g1930 [Persea americana]
MVACGFDLNFQYVLPGWEGSATDARVLQNALGRPDPLVVPRGRYYLVDGAYANQPGFLAPYRTARYHLANFRRKNPINSREVFNKMHSQARNVIERAFGILKNRFGILKTAPPYDIHVQVDIVIACCVLHNFIRMNGGHTFDEELLEDHLDDVNLNEENDLNSALASADEMDSLVIIFFRYGVDESS